MKTIWIVLISFVATAIVVGGGTYYYINHRATTDKNNLQAQINTLNSKLTAAGKSLADTQAANQAAASTAAATVSTDPTANWKTYTNTTYNYSIKYPSNLILSEYSKEGVGFYQTAPSSGYEVAAYVSISVIKLGDQTFAQYLASETASSSRNSITDATVNGLPAKHNKSEGMTEYDSYLIQSGTNVIDFNAIGTISGDAKTMLDSFTLIK